MNRSQSKIRHIQNSNLLLEQRFLNEESSQMFSTAISKLSTEMGEPIDPEMAKEASSCSFDEIELDGDQKPESVNAFQEIKQKIKDKLLSKSKEDLKTAFKEIRQILKSNKGKDQTTETSYLQEQTGALLVATTILGVTAPLWVWIAIGIIVLILLLKAIIALSSWIPRSSGRGCRRVKTFRVR